MYRELFYVPDAAMDSLDGQCVRSVVVPFRELLYVPGIILCTECCHGQFGQSVCQVDSIMFLGTTLRTRCCHGQSRRLVRQIGSG